MLAVAKVDVGDSIPLKKRKYNKIRPWTLIVSSSCQVLLTLLLVESLGDKTNE